MNNTNVTKLTEQLDELLEGTDLHVHRVAVESLTSIEDWWNSLSIAYRAATSMERALTDAPTHVIKVTITYNSHERDNLPPAFIGNEIPVIIDVDNKMSLPRWFEFDSPDHDWTDIDTINSWAGVAAV